MSSTWKEASRLGWHNSDLKDSELGIDRLTIGCLQRIADATELMAKNYSSLIGERDRNWRWYQEEKHRRESADRRINALRGVITKLKKKQGAT